MGHNSIVRNDLFVESEDISMKKIVVFAMLVVCLSAMVTGCGNKITAQRTHLLPRKQQMKRHRRQRMKIITQQRQMRRMTTKTMTTIYRMM